MSDVQLDAPVSHAKAALAASEAAAGQDPCLDPERLTEVEEWRLVSDYQARRIEELMVQAEQAAELASNLVTSLRDVEVRLGWIEHDRREPDKILCNVQSARGVILRALSVVLNNEDRDDEVTISIYGTCTCPASREEAPAEGFRRYWLQGEARTKLGDWHYENCPLRRNP